VCVCVCERTRACVCVWAGGGHAWKLSTHQLTTQTMLRHMRARSVTFERNWSLLWLTHWGIIHLTFFSHCSSSSPFLWWTHLWNMFHCQSWQTIENGEWQLMEGAHSLMCLAISGSLELPVFHISVLDVGEGKGNRRMCFRSD